MRSHVIPVLVVVGLCLTACGSSGDESEAIHGVWYWEPADGYEAFESDGTWSVHVGHGPPHDWGTYTLENGILTMSNADDSEMASPSG